MSLGRPPHLMICGIDLQVFTKRPTPEELGAIVADMPSDEQAEFFMAFGEQLRNMCGGREALQWQAISDSIAKLEHELCDGSASQVINEIQCRLAASADNENQNRAERAYERQCEDFHDGGSTAFRSLRDQQIEALKLK